MLVRGDSLSKSMSQYLIDQIGETSNIEVWYHTNVVEAHGEDHLESIGVRNSETGKVQNHPARSLFIFIGAQPRTDWLADVVERDEHGFIPAGPDLMHDGQRPKGWNLDRDPYLLETSVPGVFVAGDVRRGSVKRVASGVGEGSISISFIHQYLSKL
jgi:thioredoxin reductase (NADPH)